VNRPAVKAFFDPATYTITYVVWDSRSGDAAVIDSVLDFDAKSGRTSTASADEVIAYTKTNDLSVNWILETHVHADHLTAARYLKDQLGARTGIGAGIVAVQDTFAGIFNLGPEFSIDGSQFDRLFADQDSFELGGLSPKAIATPGHTPACMTYLIGDALFVGDTLFMPDFGTARTDFPHGDAATLYRSIQRILAEPADTRLFTGHDYKAPGRDEYAWETTVAAQCVNNVHVGNGISEEEFVKLRTERDASLAVPALLLPAVQVNMRAGELPPAENNGTHYLKLPLNVL